MASAANPKTAGAIFRLDHDRRAPGLGGLSLPRSLGGPATSASGKLAACLLGDAVCGAIVAHGALGAAGSALSFLRRALDELGWLRLQRDPFSTRLTGLLAPHRDGRQDRRGGIGAPCRPASRSYLVDIDIDRFEAHQRSAIGYSQGDDLIRAFTARLKKTPRRAA